MNRLLIWALVFMALQPLVSSFAHAGIESNDWKSYLNQSCDTTIIGGAKKILGEKEFWVHVDVSMDSWAQSTRLEQPEGMCYATYQSPSERTKLMQCLAYIRTNWEWYARCKPVVQYACRKAGGYC